MAITVAQLIAQVSSNGVSQVKGELAALGAASDAAGISLKTLAIGSAAIAGAAIVGVGIAATKMAGDFQQGITQLETGAGELHNNLGLVSSGILQMAKDTGTSTQQLISGMFEIESAGYHGSAGLEVLKAAAEGAKTGNADLGDTANAVTTVMKVYASQNVTAAQATNTLLAIVSNGKTHMGDLASSISNVLPVAAKYGVSLTDVSAALATMTAQNGNAATSTTYLHQLIGALAAPTTQAQDALKSIGLSAQEVSDEMKKSLPDTLQMITDAIAKKFPAGSEAANQAFKDIMGGSKQMQGALLLTGSSMEDFRTNVGKISSAVKDGGNSINGWSATQQDFNFKMSKAKEVVETLMISLGTKLLPTVGNLVDVFTTKAVPAVVTVTAKMTDLIGFIDKHQGLLDTVKALFLGISTALVVAVVPAIWASVVALGSQAAAAITADIAVGALELPFIAVAAAIAGAIFVGIQIVNHWKQISDTAKNIVGPAVSWLGQRFSDFGSWVQNVIDKVKDLINWFGNMAGAAGKAMNSAKNAVNSVPVLGGVASAMGFAEGTDYVPQTGVYDVGERGRERVILPQGARVIPNSQLRASNQGSSGSMQSTFIIQLDGNVLAQSTVKHMPGVIRLAIGTRNF